jgi:hypothetical protein
VATQSEATFTPTRAPFRRQIGRPTFWNPDADRYILNDDGFDSTVFIANSGDGLYKYSGRSTEEGIYAQGERIENEGVHQLPYNEMPNYEFL